MQIDILNTSTLSKSRCPFHQQKEGSFCLADCPHVRRAVYSTSQCARDEFLRNSSIWCFRLELIEVITNITDFFRVLSRSSWFVFGAQEVDGIATPLFEHRLAHLITQTQLESPPSQLNSRLHWF